MTFDPRFPYGPYPPYPPKPGLQMGYKHPVWTYATVGAAAASYAAFAVWLGMRLSTSAILDCGVYLDSGNEFAIGIGFLFTVPVAAGVSFVLSLLAARIHPMVGLTVAIVLALVVAYWCLGGTSVQIQQSGDPALCPSGLPTWWPWWLPS